MVTLWEGKNALWQREKPAERLISSVDANGGGEADGGGDCSEELTIGCKRGWVVWPEISQAESRTFGVRRFGEVICGGGRTLRLKNRS